MTSSPFKASFFQKLRSYWAPVQIEVPEAILASPLELYLYRNQWQLAEGDAIYSDGDRYLPFRLAFQALSDRLGQVGEVLVLGTGLGSIAQILHGKYGLRPNISLVDINGQSLELALHLLKSRGIQAIEGHRADAYDFMLQSEKKYDLICIDVFNRRIVPPKFLRKDFLKAVRSGLLPGGIWVMNYILEDEQGYTRFFQNVMEVFQDPQIIFIRQNAILHGFRGSIGP